MATGLMVGPTPKRKILLSVKDWSSEESIHTWKFLKSHLLQAKQEGAWKDELLVVHIARSKEKEKDKWDHGNAVIADLATSLQPFKHDVYDLEGDAGQLLVDIAHREQADILVLASRGRNAMKKAMMGSMTDSVIQRVSCPCLVVKPQIGAGDTYRMKTAAQPQAMPLQQFGPAAAAILQPVRANSPSSSPMYGRMASSLAMPFNRRVAIVYDTTATGRFLLKWATDMVLEPADNVFVVRAVPKVRQPSTSFADKNSVQRMAHDMLPSQAHVTAFNVQFSQQQGNRCRSVLSFVAKESVDLLIIGLYKTSSRRKGLALKGNALALASRCACSCLVVPMSESGLVSCAEAADLEATAEEEEELVSGSENESDDDDPTTPTAHNGAAGDTDEEAGVPSAVETGAGSPDTHGGSFAMRGASAMKQIRAPLEALFKRRGSTAPGGMTRERDGEGGTTSGGGGLPSGLDARRTALLATLHGSSGGLPAGKYVVEVDQSGALKHIKVLVEKHHGGIAPIAVTTAAAEGDQIRMVTTPADASAGAEGAAAGAGPLAASNSSATSAVHRQASTAAGAAPAPSPTAPSGIPASSPTGSLTTEAAAAAAAAAADGTAGTAGATAGQQQPRRTLSASQLAAAGAVVQEQ